MSSITRNCKHEEWEKEIERDKLTKQIKSFSDGVKKSKRVKENDIKKEKDNLY